MLLLFLLLVTDTPLFFLSFAQLPTPSQTAVVPAAATTPAAKSTIWYPS